MGYLLRRRASGPHLRVCTSMLATGRVIGMLLLVVAVAGHGHHRKHEREHGKDECLNQADEQLEAVEDVDQQEWHEEAHHEEKHLARENVAKETEGEADQAG